MGWFDRFKKPKAQPAQNPAVREDRVQIYNFATQTISTIPARELAPGMLPGKMEGVDGTVWIDPKYVQKGEYQHPPFEDQNRERMRQLKSALDEVYPLSLEEWEDGFRRDKNMEREMAVWFRIATIYSRLISSEELPLAEKRDIFKVLLSCANNPTDKVLTMAGTKVLSRPEAEAVMAEYYGKPDS